MDSRADTEVERGRRACAEQAWLAGYEALSGGDAAAPLGAPDLELLAQAAYMVGRVDDFLATLERAYQARVDAVERLPAARAAFYLGINLAIMGDMAQAGGWLARAERLVEREGRECAERGYLLLPVAIRHEAAGDYASASEAAAEAAAIGERFGDRDLFALGAHTQGLVLLKLARLEEGFSLLDEAMLAAIGGELSPIVTGVVYCSAIAGCEEAYELGRAREWTEALARWWDGQPEMVAFTGRCLSHRAEVLQLHGDWRRALDEAKLARARSERAMNRPAAGRAWYQQAELHRRKGELADAEAAFRQANACGYETQPGLALLRLAQGDVDTAAAGIRRALAETADPLRRTKLLPACAETMVAAGDLEEARGVSTELADAAVAYPSPMLSAIAAYVEGSVELAGGDAAAALTALRRACDGWERLAAPYEAARTRILVALACRALGDDDAATFELDAARAVFVDLGAGPDIARVEGLTRTRTGGHGLTARELEVLRLVAAGRTNREIAATLVLSEHTVARHVQNIFAKLRVSSRTAATAFAYEHNLV